MKNNSGTLSKWKIKRFNLCTNIIYSQNQYIENIKELKIEY